jgi:hypothetical protein
LGYSYFDPWQSFGFAYHSEKTVSPRNKGFAASSETMLTRMDLRGEGNLSRRHLSEIVNNNGTCRSFTLPRISVNVPEGIFFRGEGLITYTKRLDKTTTTRTTHVMRTRTSLMDQLHGNMLAARNKNKLYTPRIFNNTLPNEYKYACTQIYETTNTTNTLLIYVI